MSNLRSYFFNPIASWLNPIVEPKIWVVSLISCQERKMVPIRATNQAQVGAHIRSHVSDFLIFFQRLATCLENPNSEGDEIAQQLAWNFPNSTSEADLIDTVNKILAGLSDEEIVKEFYGLSMTGDNSYKICIEGPLNLIDL